MGEAQGISIAIDSPWDWGQIDIKLGTKHVIYQKLTEFLQKKVMC